jgi:type IV secretory pathway TrbF-like protein
MEQQAAQKKPRPVHAISVEHPNVKATKSVNKSISMLKGMTFMSWIFCFLVTTVALAFAYISNENANDRAFVVTDFGTLSAVNNKFSDRNSRAIEVDNHIRSFIKNMYDFDEYNYKDHIEKGYELIGAQGDKIVAAYNKADTYDKLRSQNMKVESTIDSIHVDITKNPYVAQVLFHQTLETSTRKLEYVNFATMTLRNVSRKAITNPHGLKIENWELQTKELTK